MALQSQSVYLSVAHRYWNGLWSHEQNREVYGRSASPEGVGSNLCVELGVEVTHARDLDFAIWLNRLKQHADHRCFWTDVDAFRHESSTLERITQHLAGLVFTWPCPEGHWAFLKVSENERLSCLWTPKAELVLEIKSYNLRLFVQGSIDADSGLIARRGEIEKAVAEVCHSLSRQPLDEAAWSEAVFRSLSSKVKGLREVHIDLGRQKTLRVSLDT